MHRAPTGAAVGPTGRHSGLFARAFVLGMGIVDGLDGWWTAHLAKRSSARSARASRGMCLCVGGASLATAGLGAASRWSPGVGAWAQAHEVTIALGVAGGVFAGFLAGMAAWPRRATARVATTR